jgi:hypothetical protein
MRVLNYSFTHLLNFSLEHWKCIFPIQNYDGDNK